MQVQRIDHFSFTVGDLEASMAFYRRFGFDPGRRFSSAGPDVDAGADVERADMEIQLLHHPAGPSLELIRYVHHPVEGSPHNSRVGAAHLAFAVADIAAAHRELSEAGVPFLSPPNTDEQGLRWVYMRDPDGNVVELLQPA